MGHASMKILGIGYALPGRKVGNDELVQEILARNQPYLAGGAIGEIKRLLREYFETSGTVTRYHRGVGEKALDVAVRAGKAVFRETGVHPEAVDLLIYAGVGRGWIEPAMSNLFQCELGLQSATCFDVLDACASWIRGLAIARCFLAQKTYKTVMILNCECNFREYANFDIRTPKDLEHAFSAFTIGEAATATLLTNAENDDSEFSFKTWGEKHGLCQIALPHASEFSRGGATIEPFTFHTAPRELLSFTIRKLVGHLKEGRGVLEREHDIIIGHAVSVSTTTKVVQLLGLDPKRVFETHHRFGNTVSASLPLAMAVAEEEGRLQRGMRTLLVMGSAGVTTAYAAFTY